VKGSPDTNIWRPLMRQIEGLGGRVELGRKVVSVVHDPVEDRVGGFLLDDGELVTGDAYVSAMPVHSLRKTLPESLRALPYFDNLRHLKGAPVITMQLFFDRQIAGVDNLLFSAGTHLSVYADMAMVAPEYHRGGRSIMQFVVAPAAELIRLPDEELLRFVMDEFLRLHPAARAARLLKHTIVRIPSSVYQALPGVDKYRPDQASPVGNFFLAGDYTRQHFLASIEGATISAQRCVARISDALARGALAPAAEAFAAD
jgi:15-cis-phytoene desaturase